MRFGGRKNRPNLSALIAGPPRITPGLFRNLIRHPRSHSPESRGGSSEIRAKVYRRSVAPKPPGDPTRGAMTFGDFVALMAWHDDNHLDQLRRALDAKV